MRIRTRLILSFFILVGIGFYILVNWFADDLRVRYLESIEESLVDQATVLASLLESQIKEDKTIDVTFIKQAFKNIKNKPIDAKIYKVTKSIVDSRIYVTNAKGIVLFDSFNKTNEGKDFSQWRDVLLTLQGKYGARSTRDDPHDPTSTVLYVSAPIKANNQIMGVVTLGKPTTNIKTYIENAKTQIWLAGLIIALVVILLGTVVSSWITNPIKKLTHYARQVRDGTQTHLPKLGKSELAVMGTALDEMRAALDGKNYIENYIQTLTHEIKSPLSAIQGAAELLNEDMNPEQRNVFLKNIRTEGERIKNLVDRMLELSALENKSELNITDINLNSLINKLLERLAPIIHKKNLSVTTNIEDNLKLKGEKFLIEQMFINIIQNAIDFSPIGGIIQITSSLEQSRICIAIQDSGPGIPEFAKNKVFEKFFSLGRPETGKKSTGLGLSFAKEVIMLHKGEITIESSNEQGTRVSITF